MSGCEEVRELLVAAARGEAVSAPGTRFLREHVEACPECRRRLANERMLSAGLAAMASATPGVPPASVKAALISEFQRRQAVTPIRQPLRTAAWIAGAAIAAALLLAVFASRPRPHDPIARSVKTPGPPVTAAVLPRVVAPPVEVKPAVTPRPKAHPAKRRVAQQTPQQPDSTPEVATDFFEIPYAEPLRPDQRADIFRVQIPRAGMAVFGLPVVGGRLDSRVTADVLMGEDGVVRAVRFIR